MTDKCTCRWHRAFRYFDSSAAELKKDLVLFAHLRELNKEHTCKAKCVQGALKWTFVNVKPFDEHRQHLLSFHARQRFWCVDGDEVDIESAGQIASLREHLVLILVSNHQHHSNANCRRQFCYGI
jgi:hypothetical protein